MRELILKKKKIIIAVLSLLIYFSSLTLLSFVRAPVESKAVGKNLIESGNFEVSAEKGKAWVDVDGLYFSDTENTEKLFFTPIVLKDLQQIQVSFCVYCPENFTGTAILHVDLCTDGYDTDEQEFVVDLKAGQNQVIQTIDKGSNAPDKAQFRIFCLDAAQCKVSELNVQKINKNFRTVEKIICIATIFIFIVILFAIVSIVRGANKKVIEKTLLSERLHAKNQSKSYQEFSKKKIRLYICIFLSILYLPAILGLISKTSSFFCDVSLSGYENTANKPKFSIESFFNGEYQEGYSAWHESNLKPRGIMTKTYASIQYNCFNLGNRPIGYNKDIFESGYIDSNLCINNYPDFSKPEYQENMVNYVEKLKILQKKLARFNKYLYVYIAPSKADFHMENILQKYKNVANSSAINGTDSFSNLIGQTEIAHLICSKKNYSCKYPAFYKTGIHWSRPFEQETSVQIINDLRRITGKKYRNVVLGRVQESCIPFWRDADVYDLLNVWNKLEGHYYEYETSRNNVDDYDKIRILIQGDSFAEGLRKDILDTYPYENVFLINRNSFSVDSHGNYTHMQSWEDLDISSILDSIDVVVIEAVEPELIKFSHGFVDYLINYLDVYVPANGDKKYVKVLDCAFEDAWQSDSLNGLYERETGFVWGKKYCEVILENSKIAEKGLEIEIGISPYIFKGDRNADVLDVYVNGKKMWSQSFNEAWEGSIYISPQNLCEITDDNCYNVEIYSSKSFIPSQLGINGDDRDLSILIKYVGSAR